MSAQHTPWRAIGTSVYLADNAGGFDLRHSPNAEEHARLIAAAPELLEACKAQHLAIDRLMALLIALDADFMPTKSSIWPAVVQSSEAIAKATGAAS